MRLLSRLPSLPTQCALCHDWSHDRVCSACLSRFAPRFPRCRRCALRVPDGVAVCGACIARPPPFESVLAAFDYDHPWDTLITQFKFHCALDLAAPLARGLAEAFRAGGRPRPDRLVPVPLSPARLAERGYNQAWQIARRLPRALGCAADARLVLRIKDTPHQLTFAPEQRAANMRSAFAIEPTRRAAVRGRRIAIVDDVMTTGATAAEMSRVLLHAGAAAVEAWVVARTPAPGH